MAGRKAKTGIKEKKDKKETQIWEGHCGTKEEMVVLNMDTSIVNETVNVNVIAQDEDGYYFTHSKWVDSKLMDPHRRNKNCRLNDKHMKEYKING
jgi:hypothetical protein